MDQLRVHCPEGMPTITFSYVKMPAITTHIAVAQGAHPEWKELTISRDDKAVTARRSRQACTDEIKSSFERDSCDEYPFKSTQEGGMGASTFPVPKAENDAQGGYLGNFYSPRNGVRKPDGTRFCIAVGL